MGSMAAWKKGGAVGEDDCEMCYKHKTNPENKWEKKTKKNWKRDYEKDQPQSLLFSPGGVL